MAECTVQAGLFWAWLSAQSKQGPFGHGSVHSPISTIWAWLSAQSKQGPFGHGSVHSPISAIWAWLNVQSNQCHLGMAQCTVQSVLFWHGIQLSGSINGTKCLQRVTVAFSREINNSGNVGSNPASYGFLGVVPRRLN
jgi:hypothetical protein